jgi:hypothetical protein
MQGAVALLREAACTTSHLTASPLWQFLFRMSYRRTKMPAVQPESQTQRQSCTGFERMPKHSILAQKSVSKRYKNDMI